jgi:hemerythrin-like domain-containing protein
MKNKNLPLEMFDFLDVTHQEIQKKLSQLKETIELATSDHLEKIDTKLLSEICHFFDTAVRQHHIDEERHVFPALIASGDEKLNAMAQQLYQDHGWLESNWMELAPMLKGLINHTMWFNFEDLQHCFDVFLNLNIEHVKLEESIAYPSAKTSVWTWDSPGIGREMYVRRTVKNSDAALS